MKFFLLLSVLFQLHWQALSVESRFRTPPNATCACPGEVLTFTCIVDGGNVTIWGGSAFDCAGSGNAIELIHQNFTNGTSGVCNDGAILGEIVNVDGNFHISQLNVTASTELNNTIVTCSSDLMQNIGKSEIKVAVLAAPDNIYLADAQKDRLLFSWNSVFSNDCSSLKYNIVSDCGTCPNDTTTTTAICSDLKLTTNAAVCHFRVSSAMCDHAGNPSSPVVTVKLKVPNIPKVKVVPSYSTDSQQALERLFIIMTENQTADLFNVSGNISGSPVSYTAYGSNPVSGASFNSALDFTSNCHEERTHCGHSFIELPNSFDCPLSTVINVSISATNKLGEGPPSSPFMTECSNNFVQVVYKETSSESTISCVFQNQSDISEKTCCITYQPCDQKVPQYVQDCNEYMELDVSDSVSSGQRYCYSAIAGNDTYTVKVDGSFIAGFDHWRNISTTVRVIAIVIPCSVVFVCVTCVICAVIVYILRKKRGSGFQRLSVIMEDPLKQYLIPYNLPTAFIPHKVKKDREMRQYITSTLSVEFRRGHTYFEFTNEVENILEGKQVLLQHKTTKKWFRLVQPKELSRGDTKFYGEGIARSTFGDQYRVFIQSFGSGVRHIPHGSWIIYDHSDDQVEPDVLPLVPVCSEHFAHKVINSEKECRIEEFCAQNGLNPTAFNIFLTVEDLPERMRDQPPRDVILMDRMPKELFIGPKARQVLVNDSKTRGERQRGNEQWKVFGLLEMKKQALVLKKGSEVLYQDPRYMKGKYTVVEVDEDDVRMSKFIESKLKCRFEDGKAFYEATENEEEFLYYKKILRPEKRELISHKQLELQPLVEYFYAIDGVPAKAVKVKDLDHHKIFIQSTSQGSRCLKKGERILYLKEYISPVNPKEPHHTHPDSVTSEDEHHHIHGQKEFI